ncbi:uncharacterized protein LOC114768476 [Denticeps clupeoides]|uniref:uncharacterized protein LOC114768476 n=1 Tax=Denticeps clupeoides TaxID=299321 RepID=UPI0010A39165|nr:uncharacterized protein LOC114768476 [Denticeps clupeoides]
MTKERAQIFSPAEQELLLEGYREFSAIIRTKGNTAKAAKTRKEGWQKVADRLNAVNTSTPRTWEQVKIKYKNILQTANRKKAELQKNGGRSSGPDFIPAEELATHRSIRRPILEAIKGGTSSLEPVAGCSSGGFISVTGDVITLVPVTKEDPGDGFNDETLSEFSYAEEDPVERKFLPSAAQSEQSASSQNRGKEEDVYAIYKRNLLQKMEYRQLKMKKLEQDIEVDELKKTKLLLQIELLQKQQA